MKMKKLIKILIAVVIAVLIIGAGGLFFVTRNLDEVASTELVGVDPSTLEDGDYTGAFTTGRWANEVSVTIEDGRITDIKIIKDVAYAQEGLSDQLFEGVLNAQNTTVDTVSGATVTSKAYLKAVENALVTE